MSTPAQGPWNKFQAPTEGPWNKFAPSAPARKSPAPESRPGTPGELLAPIDIMPQEQRQQQVVNALKVGVPAAAGVGASMLLGPEAGPEAAIGTRLLFAGAQGAAANMAYTATQQAISGKNPLSEESAKETVKSGAIGAPLGAGVHGVFSGIASGLSSLAKKIPLNEAADKIASWFSPAMNPSQFGNDLRDALTGIDKAASEQKGAVVKDMISQFPLKNPLSGSSSGNAISLDNTKQVLSSAIKTLEGQRQLTPTLFAAGESKARTLSVLNDLQSSINSDKIGSIQALDQLRTDLFKLGAGMDRSLPKSMVSQLTHAVHEDIGDTLGQFGLSGEKAFSQFEAASKNVRQIKDTLEQSVFKRVLNDNVNQPEKVYQILTAPGGAESTVGDLQQLLKRSPNGAQLQNQLKGIAIRDMATRVGAWEKLPDPAKEVLFGADLPQIKEFFDLAKQSQSAKSAPLLQKIAVHAGSVVGGYAAGSTVGHPMIGVGVGEGVATWVLNQAGRQLTISGDAMATLLSNPSTRQIAIKALKTPATSAQAMILGKALGNFVSQQPMSVQPVAQSQQVPTGASIADILRSKGQAPPQVAPSQPGLPFHPGAGL